MGCVVGIDMIPLSLAIIMSCFSMTRMYHRLVKYKSMQNVPPSVA